MNRSFTIKGLVITFIGFVFQQFEIEVGEEDLEIFLNVFFAFLQLAGIALAYFGRWRKGDITLTGKRKKNDQF